MAVEPQKVQIDLVLRLDPKVAGVLAELPAATDVAPVAGSTSAPPPFTTTPAPKPKGETKRRSPSPPVARPNTPELPQPEQKSVPKYAQGLYRLAEAMVGALGQGDVDAIWRWPDDYDDEHDDWERFFDPKFQSCIAEALLDLARVSRATIWQVSRNSAARTHFLQYIKYEYSTTKIGTKGTYRQLDAKSAYTDAFRNAADFFRVWRP
jgi:hypothetical protein